MKHSKDEIVKTCNTNVQNVQDFVPIKSGLIFGCGFRNLELSRQCSDGVHPRLEAGPAPPYDVGFFHRQKPLHEAEASHGIRWASGNELAVVTTGRERLTVITWPIILRPPVMVIPPYPGR